MKEYKFEIDGRIVVYVFASYQQALEEVTADHAGKEVKPVDE